MRTLRRFITLKHFLAHYCCVNATAMQMYSFRHFKGHKGCISRERQRKCQQMHFFESQNILVVSSWSLDDSRSLIGTDDVLPLVVSPRARRQFSRIDISGDSGSASSFERLMWVGLVVRGRSNTEHDSFFKLHRFWNLQEPLSPSHTFPVWTTEADPLTITELSLFRRFPS